MAREQRQLLFRYGGLGTELAGGIIGFVLLGWWIDRSFGTAPLWLAVLSTVGCIGGLFYVIKRAIELQKQLSREEKREGHDR